MARIKVKITDHQGGSKKPDLLQCLCDAEAYVNCIIENKEAFFLVTDHINMDKILGDEVRSSFLAKGMEAQFPPEHAAARTVILKNVDSSISHMTEEEIVSNMCPRMPVEKIIKIPNASHLLKIVFVKAESADRAVIQGIKIQFQRFSGGSIEKEMFVAVVPCYRCYSYEHPKRGCSKPQSYKICSNCANEGHIYNECTSSVFKCVNCSGEHRTLAAKCPVRKDLIRKRIKEKRKTQVETRAFRVAQPTVMTNWVPKMPENYLAVMAAAITIAEKREMEEPGVFQYIINEMCKANNIPEVRFPESVIRKKDPQKEKESKKRPRTSDEEGHY